MARQLGSIACYLKHAAVATKSVCDCDTGAVAKQLQLCLLVGQLHLAKLHVLVLPVLQPCRKLVSIVGQTIDCLHCSWLTALRFTLEYTEKIPSDSISHIRIWHQGFSPW